MVTQGREGPSLQEGGLTCRPGPSLLCPQDVNGRCAQGPPALESSTFACGGCFSFLNTICAEKGSS